MSTQPDPSKLPDEVKTKLDEARNSTATGTQQPEGQRNATDPDPGKETSAGAKD